MLKVTTRDLGDAAEIRVRDNGTGIPADIRDKLFQPFFTTKPTGEGTGLGLSISYDVVTQQHGGTITVQSEVGLIPNSPSRSHASPRRSRCSLQLTRAIIVDAQPDPIALIVLVLWTFVMCGWMFAVVSRPCTGTRQSTTLAVHPKSSMPRCQPRCVGRPTTTTTFWSSRRSSTPCA